MDIIDGEDGWRIIRVEGWHEVEGELEITHEYKDGLAVNLNLETTAVTRIFGVGMCIWEINTEESCWIERRLFKDWTNPTEREIVMYEIVTGKPIDWTEEK